MEPGTLERLNKRLADTRGRNPHGQPVYRWFRSCDLLYPCRNAAGNYEQLRQVDDDCYVIGMWSAPMPESEWRAQFPDIGYPHQGMYYATDIMLRQGHEPTDSRTDEVAGLIKSSELKTFRDCLDEIEASRGKREKANASIISDVIDDSVTAFGNLPGSRGGSVSFGGIDATLINPEAKPSEQDVIAGIEHAAAELQSGRDDRLDLLTDEVLEKEEVKRQQEFIEHKKSGTCEGANCWCFYMKKKRRVQRQLQTA